MLLVKYFWDIINFVPTYIIIINFPMKYIFGYFISIYFYFYIYCNNCNLSFRFLSCNTNRTDKCSLKLGILIKYVYKVKINNLDYMIMKPIHSLPYFFISNIIKFL